MNKTIFVSIGNSDDKLTQQEWAMFYQDVDRDIRAFAKEVHGNWRSDSTHPWQNACWAFTVKSPEVKVMIVLRNRLRNLADRYKQDSIMWCMGTPEFLENVREDDEQASVRVQP